MGKGRLDLFKTHFADDTPVLYRNKGQGRFEDITGRSGLAAFTRYVGWGAGFADFDNDGLADLLFVNGSVYPEIETLFAEYKYRNPRIAAAQCRRRQLRKRERAQRPRNHRIATPAAAARSAISTTMATSMSWS